MQQIIVAFVSPPPPFVAVVVAAVAVGGVQILVPPVGGASFPKMFRWNDRRLIRLGWFQLQFQFQNFRY